MNQDQIESHLSFRKHELGTDSNEFKWLKWADHLEAILEHDLDGDQQEDGYSIDTAVDFYEDNLTVLEAAVEFAALKSLAHSEPESDESDPSGPTHEEEPDPSGPIHECRYNCSEAEHVGNQIYVCLHADHWKE